MVEDSVEKLDIQEEAKELDEAVSQMEVISTQIGWIARRRLEQELERFSLTVPQYMTLRCIKETGGGCTMSQLAESTYQVSATMTGIVDRLEDRGWVSRERDPYDRRTLRVVLTPQGDELLERIRAQKREWIAGMMAALHPHERTLMIQLGKRYLETILKAK